MLEGMNEHFLDLGVGGMSCASCVSRIERVLGQQTGVISVSVNLANETARVVFKEAPSDDALAQIKRAVRAAGRVEGEEAPASVRDPWGDHEDVIGAHEQVQSHLDSDQQHD